MPNQSPDRLEIFFALALDSGAKRIRAAQNSTLAAKIEIPDSETDSETKNEERFAVILNYLTEKEAEKFQRLRENYQDKKASDQAEWQTEIRRKIGTDEQLIDETVHWSYVDEMLWKEIPAVRKIIFDSLSPAHRKAVNPLSEEVEESGRKPTALEKTMRRAFAGQFVALRDLPKPTAFDRLNGAQMARLIRLTGIREVALACLQIEAVELVAAFLRRFSAEDAQAIAAQLNNLPKMSEARLEFAENLVQTMIEIESQPSAMLDLLGINLIGIALCASRNERVVYANQKLPLEVAARLPEIIEERCRAAPEDLQREIRAEVEQTAQTIFRNAAGKRRVKS